MEVTCERTDSQSEIKRTEDCFERTFSALTVDDVYEIAKVIGTEVEKLIDGYGKDSAVGLVPRIVKVLEFLESFASRNQAHKQREDELLRAFETLQLQQQRRRTVKEIEEGSNNRKNETWDLQQKEDQWRVKCEELQTQVQQLVGQNQELQGRLKGSYEQEDRVQRQEREVMLKLKEVVDKQRDELRAKVQQISTVSREVEALQEQLERFMKMNGELRHRQSVLQTQLKSTVERKADMEADLRQKDHLIQDLRTRLERAGGSPSRPGPSPLKLTDNAAANQKDPNLPCFTKQEVRDILHERNELKANLFLVQEELNYYQREILNDERCPGFLLEAVRATIRKQRTLIKAKMLGIPAEECSSDEEEKGPLFERKDTVDGPEDKPAESRIRNLFGLLSRSGNSRSPAHMSSSTSTWEIIGDSEANGDAELTGPSP